MFRRKGRFARKPRAVNRAAIFRPKPPCPLLSAGITEVDYKNTAFLSRYVNEDWKIRPAGFNNISARMQRQIKSAVKRARFLALMPYNTHHHLTAAKDQ